MSTAAKDQSPMHGWRSRGFAEHFVALVGSLLVLGCGSRRSIDDASVGLETQRADTVPVVSDSFPIVSPVLGFRSDAPIIAAASGNGTYLLVYHIDRGGLHHRLIGVRVRSSDGAILDPDGFDIASIELPGVLSVVATYAVDRWIVVYEGESRALRAVTVSSAGVVGTPTDLSWAPATGVHLVWGSDRALLTTDAGEGLFIDAAGSPIGAKMAIFSSVSPQLSGGTAAFDGTSFLVSAARQLVSSGARVSLFSVTNAGPTGKSADAFSASRSSALASTGSVVSDGSGFLVTYMASPPTCAAGGRCTPRVPYYRTASVEPNGDVLPDADSQLDELMDPLRAVHTNGSYLLHRGESVLRVDSNGAALGPIAPLLRGVSSEFFAALSISGFELLPLGTSELLAYSGPLVIRVHTDLTPLDSPPLAPLELVKPQRSPAVAFDGTNYVVAWSDSGREGLRAARVATTGAVLDPVPITVADGRADGLVAVGNTAGTLVAWLEGDPLRLARIGPTGGATSVDVTSLAAPFVLTAAVASNGTDYFAAWSTPVVVSDPPNVRAARVSSNGDPSVPVVLSTPYERVAAEFDGSNYVVVQAVGDDERRELRATRVTPALVVLDEPSRALFDYPASYVYDAPVIASNGSGALLVWFEREAESAPIVRAARVTQSLEVLDPGGVTIGRGSYPTNGLAAAWDGSSYWVLWADGAGAAVGQLRILGRRLTAAAVSIDDEPFVVASDLAGRALFPDFLLDVTRGPNGDLLLASVSDEPTRDGQTVRGRFLRSAVGGTGGSGGDAGGEAGSGGSTTGGSATGGVAGGGSSAGGAPGGQSGEAGEAGEVGAGDGGQPSGGRGGASGTGGSVPGGTGGSATGGQAAGEAGGGVAGGGTPPDDSGCSCSLPGSAPSSSSFLLAALGLLGLLRARRVDRARAS